MENVECSNCMHRIMTRMIFVHPSSNNIRIWRSIMALASALLLIITHRQTDSTRAALKMSSFCARPSICSQRTTLPPSKSSSVLVCSCVCMCVDMYTNRPYNQLWWSIHETHRAECTATDMAERSQHISSPKINHLVMVCVCVAHCSREKEKKSGACGRHYKREWTGRQVFAR